jgi:hypothetical protein
LKEFYEAFGQEMPAGILEALEGHDWEVKVKDLLRIWSDERVVAMRPVTIIGTEEPIK